MTIIKVYSLDVIQVHVDIDINIFWKPVYGTMLGGQSKTHSGMVDSLPSPHNGHFILTQDILSIRFTSH